MTVRSNLFAPSLHGRFLSRAALIALSILVSNPTAICLAQHEDRYRVVLAEQADGSLETVNLLHAKVEESIDGEILVAGSCGWEFSNLCLTNIDRAQTAVRDELLGSVASISSNGTFVAQTWTPEPPYSSYAHYTDEGRIPLALPESQNVWISSANGEGHAVGSVALTATPFTAGIIITSSENEMLSEHLPTGSHMHGARDINESGQIVGDGYNSSGALVAFILTPMAGGGYSVTELESPFPGHAIALIDINNRGDVLGRLEIPNNEPLHFVLLAGATQATPLIDFSRPEHLFMANKLTDSRIVSGLVVGQNPSSSYPAIFNLSSSTLTDASNLAVSPNFTINEILDISRNGRALFVSGSDELLGGGNAILRRLCRGDNNGDGAMNSTDFFAFLAQFFAQSIVADLDRSGLIDSSDFFYFLEEFHNPRQC